MKQEFKNKNLEKTNYNLTCDLLLQHQKVWDEEDKQESMDPELWSKVWLIGQSRVQSKDTHKNLHIYWDKPNNIDPRPKGKNMLFVYKEDGVVRFTWLKYRNATKNNAAKNGKLHELEVPYFSENDIAAIAGMVNQAGFNGAAFMAALHAYRTKGAD